MKGCRFKFSISFAVVIVLGIIMPTNAGDLNPPPGAIASTNCTQINEDAIGPLPFTISTPGCYVLTSNIEAQPGHTGDGIVINDGVSGVALDLNGFAVIGVSGSGDGIRFLGGSGLDIAIRNGTVRDWGSDGIDVAGVGHCRITGVHVQNNSNTGMRVGAFSIIANCTARDNVLVGISAAARCTVRGCTVSTSATGIAAASGSSVIGCAATGNGTGISAGSDSTVTDCTSGSNSLDGFQIGAGSTISNCTAGFNQGDGIQVSDSTYVIGNSCRTNGVITGGGAGIHVLGSSNRIEGNNVISNDGPGILVDSAANLIIKNSASGNGSGTNYSIVAGNDDAQIISNPGTGFINSNPWANFEF